MSMLQQVGSFQFERRKRRELGYLLFAPRASGATRRKRWPLVVFLHGAHERGTDPGKLIASGLPSFVEQHPEFPSMVLSRNVHLTHHGGAGWARCAR